MGEGRLLYEVLPELTTNSIGRPIIIRDDDFDTPLPEVNQVSAFQG